MSSDSQFLDYRYVFIELWHYERKFKHIFLLM